MTPEEAHLVRVNEVVIGNDSDHNLPNHVASGFRVTAILPNGLQLQRLNAVYLREGVPIETWVSRWDQMRGMRLLPDGAQLPLL